MNDTHATFSANSRDDLERIALERMIEPLASYICATERPRAALRSALAALCCEVEHTHSAASAHLTTFLENHAA